MTNSRSHRTTEEVFEDHLQKRLAGDLEGGFAYLVWRGFNGDKHVCDGADSYAIREGKIIMQTIHYTVKES